MYQRLKYSLKYILYLLLAKHKKGHGIHSPFIFDLIRKVFNCKAPDESLEKVFLSYDKIKRSKQTLTYEEIGAGSSYKKHSRQKVGEIVKKSSITKKYGQLLYNLVKYFNSQNILELGTSVGMSTSFLAQANPKSNFTSIEGVLEKVKVAKNIAEELHQNTKFVVGMFDDQLEKILEEYSRLDFVYIDGNHTKKSTLNYFYSCLGKIHSDTVFVFDDIHWSKGMEEAWNEIKNHKKVKLSVDIFRMGLIFFKKELSNQHYVIKF